MKLLTILAPTLLFISLGPKLDAGAAPAVSGDYVEVRTNHVYTCGCLFSGEQVTVGREAILAWAIERGVFREVPLENVRAVAVIQGTDNLALDGTTRKSVIFVNNESSVEQRQALVEMLRAEYGDVLGEIQKVHTAPISFRKDGDRITVNVDPVAQLVVRPSRLPQDAHQGSSRWYEPFIPTGRATLATTEYSRFSGDDFRHQWWTGEPGITGYIATFALRP